MDTKNTKTEENRRQLYDRQVELLKTFLERGAISKAQFDKSFGDLTQKMGYTVEK